MINEKFELEALSPLIGSEVHGLDLSKPINPDALKRLRTAWLARKVLFFRDQKLNPEQQLNFTRQFGELDRYPYLEGLKEYPEIAEVLKLPEEEINFGGVWHTDTTYLEEPAAGATLYAIELPPVGGDTIFCNMCSAYEALPEDVKKKVNGLNAINASSKAAISKTRLNRLPDGGSTAKEFISTHPVVRTHPETHEKILYVNEAHTLHFEGWSEEESDSLLNFLYQHARKPEFQCRFRWSIGATVLWDNRSTHHYPVNDYSGSRRLLHRVSLKGDRPY